MAKRSLYQALQVSQTAELEVIKAAYEARLVALQNSAAPEVAAERTIAREAYELLSDPVRRKLYDARLRDEQLRARSSGGEETRANLAGSTPLGFEDATQGAAQRWFTGAALLIATGIGGSWIWLDHKHKVEAQRLEAQRLAEEARQKEELAKLQRETVDWAKDRIDTDRMSAEQRRQELARLRDRQRSDYEAQRHAQQTQVEDRRRAMEQQRLAADERRQEQENLRRSQQQLERDRRYLQELERNRGMSIPAR